MGRGLYGQMEGGEVNPAAEADRFADVDSEGVHVGFKTEAQYRDEMASHASEDATYRNLENRQVAKLVKKGARITNDGTVVVARIKQRSALVDLAAVAEEMLEEGFSLTIVQKNLTIAPAIAASRRVHVRALPKENPLVAALKARRAAQSV